MWNNPLCDIQIYYDATRGRVDPAPDWDYLTAFKYNEA